MARICTWAWAVTFAVALLCQLVLLKCIPLLVCISLTDYNCVQIITKSSLAQSPRSQILRAVHETRSHICEKGCSQTVFSVCLQCAVMLTVMLLALQGMCRLTDLSQLLQAPRLVMPTSSL